MTNKEAIEAIIALSQEYILPDSEITDKEFANRVIGIIDPKPIDNEQH